MAMKYFSKLIHNNFVWTDTRLSRSVYTLDEGCGFLVFLSLLFENIGQPSPVFEGSSTVPSGSEGTLPTARMNGVS